VALFAFTHSFIEVLLLFFRDKALPLPFKFLFVVAELLPFEFACNGIEHNFGFELLLLYEFVFFEDSINGLLPVFLVEPLIFGYIVEVHLLIDYVLCGIVGTVSFDQLIFMQYRH
jgi:hypothetical protein